MTQEFFQSEKAELAKVKKEAVEKGEKGAGLEITLTQSHHVLESADEAAALIAKAKKDLADDPTAHAELDRQQFEISNTLLQMAETGRELLAGSEKSEANPNYESVAQLAESVKAFAESAKAEVPIYVIVGEAKKMLKKAKNGEIKVSEAIAKRNILNPIAFKDEVADTTEEPFNLLMEANELLKNLGDAAASSPQLQEFYLAAQEEVTQHMRALAEIRVQYDAGDIIDHTRYDGLEKNQKTINDLNPDLEKILALKEEFLHAPLTEEGRAEKISEMKKITDTTLDVVAQVLRNLNEVPQKFLDKNYEYRAIHEVLLSQVKEHLISLAEVKGYCEAAQIIQTDEFKDYYKVKPDGSFDVAEAFYRLPKERQAQLNEKLEEIRSKIALEMDEKTLSPDQKSYIEGKRKLQQGDRIGAKQDLLKYLYEQAKISDPKNELRVEEVKELLRQIAKLEIEEARARIEGMRDPIQGRFDSHKFAGEKRKYGTFTKDQAYVMLDAMARVLDEAEKMVESGKALTIGDAEIALRKYQTKNSDAPDLKPALDIFQTGFRTDMRGHNANDVFDVFTQQRLLNEPDPVKRQQNILDLAREARERGLTDLARQYYELYFAKELEEKERSSVMTINREKVREVFLKDLENKEKIETAMEAWEEKFEHTKKRKPTAEEKHKIHELMVEDMVEIAYKKEIKKEVHKDFPVPGYNEGSMPEGGGGSEGASAVGREGESGERTLENQIWNEAYGGNIVLEDLGTGWFTADEWNGLGDRILIKSILVYNSVMGAELAGLVGGAALPGMLSTGVGHLGIESLGLTLTHGALEGMVENEWGAFHGTHFLTHWGKNAATMGLLNVLGRASAAVGKAAETKVAHWARKMSPSTAKTLSKGADIGAKVGFEGSALSALSIGSEYLHGRRLRYSDVAKITAANFAFAGAFLGMEHLRGIHNGEQVGPHEMLHTGTSHGGGHGPHSKSMELAGHVEEGSRRAGKGLRGQEG